MTVRRAIFQFFPPGAERDAWLRWLARFKLSRLRPGYRLPGLSLVMHPLQFERVFSESWERDEAARKEARQIAFDHKCVIDESKHPEMLGFKKL